MLRISMTFPPRDMERLGSLAVEFAKHINIDQVIEGPEFIRFNVEDSRRLDLWLESWIRVLRNDSPYGSLKIEKVEDGANHAGREPGTVTDSMDSGR